MAGFRYPNFLRQFLGQLFLPGNTAQADPNMLIVQGPNQTGDAIRYNTSAGRTAMRVDAGGNVSTAAIFDGSGTAGTSGQVLSTTGTGTAWITPSAGSSYTFSTGLTNAGGTVTSNLTTGISGGQTAYGGTASGDSLTINSTSSATQGTVFIQSLGGTTQLGTTSRGAQAAVRLWAVDDGLGTSGLFCLYTTYGTWQTPGGLEGITVNASTGAKTGWNPLYISYYSSGYTSIGNGGGGVAVGTDPGSMPSGFKFLITGNSKSAGYVWLTDQGTEPSAPTSGSIIYAYAGALKCIGSSGTRTTLGNA